MTEPRVSVIAIFLDEERFLTEAVDSVLGQDFADYELLLVDDGSGDASPRIAQDYAAKHPGRMRSCATNCWLALTSSCSYA